MPKKPLPRKPHRPLSTIAKEIQEDIYNGNWSAENRYCAAPYLRAMHELNEITDHYLLDSGKSIVRYFLSNAATWRGETARRIKEELRGMLA